MDWLEVTKMITDAYLEWSLEKFFLTFRSFVTEVKCDFKPDLRFYIKTSSIDDQMTGSGPGNWLKNLLFEEVKVDLKFLGHQSHTCVLSRQCWLAVCA